MYKITVKALKCQVESFCVVAVEIEFNSILKSYKA